MPKRLWPVAFSCGRRYLSRVEAELNPLLESSWNFDIQLFLTRGL